MQLIVGITTVEQKSDAQLLARKSVESQLAACVHIEEIESVYVWNGSIQTTSEFRVSFKTRLELWPALKALLLSIHPYQIPAIYALEVTDASTEYCKWVTQNTREPLP
jgi:periplasmic divalent cation tolerance protein